MKTFVNNTATAVALALAGFVGTSDTVSAQGVPTYSATEHAELIALLSSTGEMVNLDTQMLDNALLQLNELQEQLRQARATHNAITGARETIGNLFSGDITPRKLSSSLSTLSMTGNSVNNRLSNHMEELKVDFQPMTGLQIFGRDAEGPATKSHDLVSGSSMAGLAIAEEGFAGAGEAMERYDGYREQISATEDLKASIDLNTRIAVENGMMLATLLQTLSAQGQLDAAIVNQRLRGQDIVARQAYRPEGSN
ncbi:type IV secretion system protein [uncultured Ruegeria sp.]|uniref:type IV secretion system protein n=1 Tax=uncultured Ruegeria sp. TaxID=259304 RepID=UPI0026368347|nr:type IV secretion system protein [uncultured Ruegeria sp.]